MGTTLQRLNAETMYFVVFICTLTTTYPGRTSPALIKSAQHDLNKSLRLGFRRSRRAFPRPDRGRRSRHTTCQEDHGLQLVKKISGLPLFRRTVLHHRDHGILFTERLETSTYKKHLVLRPVTGLSLINLFNLFCGLSISLHKGIVNILSVKAWSKTINFPFRINRTDRELRPSICFVYVLCIPSVITSGYFPRCLPGLTMPDGAPCAHSGITLMPMASAPSSSFI